MNVIIRPRIYLSVLILMLCSWQVNAQMQISDANTPPFTPENLITNIFLGEGVEVLSVTYQGDNAQVGYFTNGLNAIGINRGLLMTSGKAASTSLTGGPYGGDGDGTDFASSSFNLNVSDPDLAAITTSPTFDVAKYTITFIPTNDTLRFNYVFASEEYPEYACTGFNDVFGFFISGPGINGAFQNNGTNIALIPGTNTPVTINNVNPGNNNSSCAANTYPQYYNDNNFTQIQPVYDGYLDVFTAQAVVIPCSTYTIKLAISDAGDGVFDTGVFLEAKSFGTGSLKVETATVSLDGTVVEGCADGSITFKLPEPAEDEFFLDYTIFGTATNGIDYLNIPTNLSIPAGDSMVTIPIIAILDNLTEGTESIGIDIQRDPCNRDTFWIYIKDNLLIPPSLPSPVTICLGDSINLDATPNIPLPEAPTFTFTNVISDTMSVTNTPYIYPINVFGVQPFILETGIIQSICMNINHKWDDDLDVFLLSPGGQFIELTTDNGGAGDNYTQTCFTEGASTPINFPGPFAPALAAPFTGNYQPEGVWSDLWGGVTNGQWRLQVVDDASGFKGRLIDWTITFNPIYKLTYEWSPTTGLSCSDCATPTATPTQTTTYIVTVTDTYGCEVYDTITINVQGVVLSPPNVNCTTITNNSITFDWDDVPGALTYEVSLDGGNNWFPINATEYTATGLTLNDSVTIFVRGISNCNGLADSITCNTPNCIPPLGAVQINTPTSCNNTSDGAVVLSTIGPDAPFTYYLGAISNQTGNFANLASGNYVATVINSLGCPGTIPFTITSPPGMSSTMNVLNDVSCFGGNDGIAQVVVQGGQLPYDYDWGGSSSATATGLSIGNYIVTITDNNDCKIQDTVTISEPTELQLLTSFQNVTCNGADNGFTSALVDGGTTPYTYIWSNNAGTNVTNDTAFMLSGGIYTITVTDINGCSKTATATVSEKPIIVLQISATAASCSGQTDATTTVVASGGAGGFTYIWSDPDAQITATATGVTVGTYTVTVTDADDCTNTASVNVVSPNSIFINSSTLPTNCWNSSDGDATITPNGGTTPYTYAWSDGASTSNVRNDLAAGAVTVTVTDDNGCFETLDLDIPSPTAITANLSSVAAKCFGGNDGTATIVAAGGSPAYSYSWNNSQQSSTATGLTAGTYTCTVEDGYGCTQTGTVVVSQSPALTINTQTTLATCFDTATGTATAAAAGGTGNFGYTWSNTQQTATATNLAAATYTVTATDSNNCTISTTALVTEPTELQTSVGVGQASCNGEPDGTATVTPSGGIAPYTYLWSDAAAQTTATATGLVAATYTVTVTDDNGCTTTNSVNIAAPPALSVQMSGTPALCNGGNSGTATVLPNGGSGGYTYDWNNTQNTATITSIAAGTYTVTVTDINNCTITGTFNVTEPTALGLTLTATNITCNGFDNGSITSTTNGGITPYNYSWNASIPYAANSKDVLNLAAATYIVTVTDDHGCTITQSASVTEPAQLGLSAITTNVKCYDGSDGNININTNGGISPYTYQWSGASNATAEDLNNISAGLYQLTVTDDNNCIATISLTITQPLAPLSSIMSVNDTICNGATNGIATVQVFGGTEPYTYLWDNAQLTTTATNLSQGSHFVTITDNNGCQYFDTTFVFEKEAIQITMIQLPAECHNGNDGKAGISMVKYGNFQAPLNSFSYVWSTSATNVAAIIDLQAGGTYAVTATDSGGCTGEASVTIGNPTPVVVNFENVTNVSCNGDTNGQATAAAAGGNADTYTFSWTTGATTATISNLSAGTYKVTATDANGCPGISQVTIYQPTALESDISTMGNLCFGGNSGTMAVNVTGGTPLYQYLWANGDISEKADSLNAGWYSVTITDFNGCLHYDSAYITEPLTPVSATTISTNPSCAGGFNGTISINAEGGTPPYLYSINGNTPNGVTEIPGIAAGTYNILVNDANACNYLVSNILITEPAPISVSLGPDLTINIGDTIQLNPSVTANQGLLVYTWSEEDTLHFACDDALCAFPYVSPVFPEYYELTVTDENGCFASDGVNILVLKKRSIEVPTGFSPFNTGGSNDLLSVYGEPGVLIKTFRVYDRWGELVYEAKDFDINDATIGWNGKFRDKEMEGGTYIWYIEAEFRADGQQQFFKGASTLIR